MEVKKPLMYIIFYLSSLEHCFFSPYMKAWSKPVSSAVETRSRVVHRILFLLESMHQGKWEPDQQCCKWAWWIISYGSAEASFSGWKTWKENSENSLWDEVAFSLRRGFCTVFKHSFGLECTRECSQLTYLKVEFEICVVIFIFSDQICMLH